MKIISLNCNHCGAPLDAPIKAKFITCSFCDSRLAIQKTGTSYSTELLEELQETTESLAKDVAIMKRRSDIEQLDRMWESEKAHFMVEKKDGGKALPTKSGGMVSIIFGCGFGIFWCVFAFGIASQVGGFAMIMPLFGLFVIGMAIFGGVSMMHKAEQYQREHSKYQSKRREMMQAKESSEPATPE